MRYLVIGDPDFLGVGVAKALRAKSSEFLFLAPTISVGTELSKLGQTITADTDNEYALKTTFSSFKPDVVFYMGSPILTPTDSYSPLLDYSHFMRSMHALSSSLEMYGATHLYLRSSYEVYGASGSKLGRKKITESERSHPITLRGAYLDAAENLLRILCFNAGIKFTSLRYFEVVGPDPADSPTGMIQSAVKSVVAGHTLFVEKEARKIDFISFADAISATKAIVKSKLIGPINIGSGCGIPVKRFFSAIKKMSNRKDSVVYQTQKSIAQYSAVANVNKLHKLFIPNNVSVEDIATLFTFYKKDDKK